MLFRMRFLWPFNAAFRRRRCRGQRQGGYSRALQPLRRLFLRALHQALRSKRALRRVPKSVLLVAAVAAVWVELHLWLNCWGWISEIVVVRRLEVMVLQARTGPERYRPWRVRRGWNSSGAETGGPGRGKDTVNECVARDPLF